MLEELFKWGQLKKRCKINRTVLIASLGLIIGIIWGLYLQISIAFIIPFFLLLTSLSKYRKMLMLFLKQILIFILMLVIGMTYIKYQ